MHRNSFIDSPRLLNKNQSLKANPNIFFAGQITGVEGYMESAASGILAGENMRRYLSGESSLDLPNITMLGALGEYITDPSVSCFQPMGANFGIIPPLSQRIRDKAERYTALSNRALDWYENNL
jgi:methylenetetrahydrofolate--tRNA-(uracil-5-)-methyltransferase